MKKSNLIITGATGFLGKELLPMIIDNYESIFLIVRSASINKAKKQFKQKNITILEGDTTTPEIFTSMDTINKLVALESCDILHMAALYDLTAPLAECYLQNVVATQNILNLSNQLSCEKLFYISTIVVSGDSQGMFLETDLFREQKFHDFYSKTKFDAEALVRKWGCKCSKIIIRPGVIVGHSVTGEYEKTDGPYYILEKLKKVMRNNIINKISTTTPVIPLPISKQSNSHLIAVDEVAAVIKMIIDSPPNNELICFHAAGDENGVKLLDFFEGVCGQYSINSKLVTIVKTPFTKYLAKLMGLPEESTNYLYDNSQFSNKLLKQYYPAFKFKDFKQYQSTIIKGAR